MAAVGDKDSHSLNSLEALCTDSNITAACTVSNRNDHPCIHNRRCTQDHNRNMVVACTAVVACMVVVECMASLKDLQCTVVDSAVGWAAECTVVVVCMANHRNNSTAAVVCTVVVWAVVCTVSHKCNNRSMAVVDSVADLVAAWVAECTDSHNNANSSHNMVAVCTVAVLINNSRNSSNLTILTLNQQ